MIILYHNVFPDLEYQKRKESRIAISRTAFEQQILWLREWFQIVTLKEYVQRTYAEPGSLRNTISITFDDGIKSTFENVYPFLSAHKIPSTMFVTTAHLDACDLLHFTYFYVLCYESEYTSINIHNESYSLLSVSQRARACYAVHSAALDSGDPLRFAKELQQIYPIPEDCTSLYAGMGSRQIRQAAREGLMEIGAHTVYHPYLSQLKSSDQLMEITRCKDTLEGLCEKPISFFAYPSGDYNEITLQLVEAAKFEAACAVIPKRLGNKVHFELERIGIYSPSLLKLQLKLIAHFLKLRELGWKFG